MVEDVARQVRSGSDSIMGVMIESNLVEGSQDLVPTQPLVYGLSITDSRVSIEATAELLGLLASAYR